MSTDWNIKCVTCNETLYFDDANHQDELMRQLIRNADAIVAIAPLLENGDVRLETYFGAVDTKWFTRHQGHVLRPIDEYGRLDGDCLKSVYCGTCKTRHRCSLPDNHLGDCNLGRPG